MNSCNNGFIPPFFILGGGQKNFFNFLRKVQDKTYSCNQKFVQSLKITQIFLGKQFSLDL